ncbi:hypothetical protein G7Y89_g5390 [Cudoniella acicularis]|uniref:Uncharacterized protein n=1 Tax=Cudoniella acicularis TaxID=354080 RepID=A0A8H4RPR9_9HELO|nr:hypothetical protein G7Y89_g5390 [Cudoniella acicularis]
MVGKLIGEGHEPSIFRYLAGGTANKLWPQSLVVKSAAGYEAVIATGCGDLKLFKLGHFPCIAAKVPIITGIKLNGSRPHKSHDDPADPKPVISFALYKSNKLNSRNRVGSGHVHDDGTGHVNFPSKYKQYRAITGMEYKPPNSGTSGQSSSGKSKSGGSDLTWRTNEQTKYAEWWDGTKWVAGDWSDEYQKWYAYYNGEWYYW